MKPVCSAVNANFGIYHLYMGNANLVSEWKNKQADLSLWFSACAICTFFECHVSVLVASQDPLLQWHFPGTTWEFPGVETEWKVMECHVLFSFIHCTSEQCHSPRWDIINCIMFHAFVVVFWLFSKLILCHFLQIGVTNPLSSNQIRAVTAHFLQIMAVTAHFLQIIAVTNPILASNHGSNSPLSSNHSSN